MRFQFIERENGPEKLLAEVEIIFEQEEPLVGLKLVGFSIWQGPESPHVTFPSRSFGASGDRRFFDFIRADQIGTDAPRRLKALILEQYLHEKAKL